MKNNEIGCKQILNGLAVRHLTVVLSVVVVVGLVVVDVGLVVVDVLSVVLCVSSQI